jgi:hypothetical protein
MTQNDIATQVASRLYTAETAIDLALAEAAGLIGLLPSARADAMLSAVAGQRAFDGAAASVVALTQARAHVVDTHNALSALARRMGIDVVAFGPIDKPEDPPTTGGGVTAMGVVNKTLT